MNDSAAPTTDPSLRRVQQLRKAIPAGGLFHEKEWRLSPDPFPLAPETVETLQRLGPILHRFQKAANLIYRRGVRGSLPPWVASYLDRGKPGSLIEHGQARFQADAVPHVIRPDLVLTKRGFALTEIDTVPGGIGLTAWLNRAYTGLGHDEVIGGSDGMLEGFSSMFHSGADIVISKEAGDYRPEMEWLAAQLDRLEPWENWDVYEAETYRPRRSAIYRFFELFDLENVPFAREMIERQVETPPMNPPMKAFLEEKLWLALFWMRPLRDVWRRELRASNWRWLRELIPYSWVVDPSPIPHHAVIPKLDVQRFEELASFTQKERKLVLKISGFSDRAWGSRGVHMAMDLSQSDWAQAIREAMASFPHHPYVLQEFRKGKRVKHPYLDQASGELKIMTGRVRLCPYYFVPAGPDAKPVLSGVLATICPEDKKILHGMSEAILAPCSVAENGH